MEKDKSRRGLDWHYGLVAGLVVALLLGGMVLRAFPGSGEGAPASSVPLRYLDLFGVALALGFLYVVRGRRHAAELRDLLEQRDGKVQRMDRQLEEHSALFEIATRAASFRDVEAVVEFVAHASRETLGADRSAVFLVEGDGLGLRAAAGDGAGAIRGLKVRLGAGVAGWVGQHHRPLLLNTDRDIDAFYPEGHPDRHLSSEMCAPLLHKGEALGVISLCRFTGGGRERFGDAQLRLLVTFADYAASAISGLRAYREIAGAHARLERNLRDLKKAQEGLIQAEKRSAVGQLLADLGRELDHPLTTVVGYSQILERVNRDPELAPCLARVSEEGSRCQEVVSRILDRARRSRGERKAIDVNEVLQATVKLRNYQLGLDDIEVEQDLAPGLPRVLADPMRLQQVFLNLLNNAHRAILDKGAAAGGERRGVIRVQTRYLKISNRVQIRVSDDGPGIPTGMEERVFEPFFTTRPEGEGIGLGLPICRGLVESFGGGIAVGRDIDIGGAAVRIELPPVPAETGDEEPRKPGERAARGKRILVVDGDEGVREMLERTLRLDDHEVCAVGSAPEAIERLEAGGFDLVMSDVVMPEMSGIDLYREIEERRGELRGRVIFFSGGALSEEMLEFFGRTGRPCLRRPFRLSEMRDSIRSSLAQELGKPTRRAPPKPAPAPGGREPGSVTAEVAGQAGPPDVAPNDPNLEKARRLARRVMQRRAGKA